MLEDKDQVPKRKCSPKTKKASKKILMAISKKKVIKIFSGDLQNFNNSKNSAVLEPKTEQFSRTWGFEAKDLTFEAKAKDFKMCPWGLHFWRQKIKVGLNLLEKQLILQF